MAARDPAPPSRTGDPELIGYSIWSPDRILTAVLRGISPTDIPGDFVVTARCAPDHPASGAKAQPAPGQDGPQAPTEMIITSAVSAHPYYYVVKDGRLLHGQDVFSLVRQAGLPWRWNQRAVRQLTLLGHPTGEDTLHPDVRRVPNAAVIRFAHGRMTINRSSFWDTLPQEPALSPLDVSDVLHEVLDELTGDHPLISLSGGFDSRLLLGRAIAVGSSPQALTMGAPDSTDQVIATRIARDLGIPHHTIELNPADYLTHAARIVRITGGTKTAANWHTYLYTVGARAYGATPHVVGTNGELVRTPYCNRGALARTLGRGGDAFVRAFFAARTEWRRRRFARYLPLLTDSPRDSLRLADEIARLVEGPGDGLAHLDRFFSVQRVRHFHGNGLALYRTNIPTVSPFLDSRWIRAAARMPRVERMGCNFHRLVIERNLPRLLEYPTPFEPVMYRRAPAGYWLRRKPPVVSYNAFAGVVQDKRVHERIIEESSLDAFTTRRQREAIVRDRVPQAIDLLLTLAHVEPVARETRVGSGCADPRARSAADGAPAGVSQVVTAR